MYNAARREEAKKRAARKICSAVQEVVKNAAASASQYMTLPEKVLNKAQGELLLEVGAQLFSAGMCMIRDSDEGVDND